MSRTTRPCRPARPAADAGALAVLSASLPASTLAPPTGDEHVPTTRAIPPPPLAPFVAAGAALEGCTCVVAATQDATWPVVLAVGTLTLALAAVAALWTLVVRELRDEECHGRTLRAPPHRLAAPPRPADAPADVLCPPPIPRGDA